MNQLAAIGALFMALPKGRLDALIDLVEQAIADSENKYDDRYVVPILKAVRIILDIPDND